MASSEQVELWSPESCWIEQIRALCCQTLEARTVYHNGGKIKLYSREVDFLNYEAKKAQP